MGTQQIQLGALQGPWKTAAAVLPNKCCSSWGSGGGGCIADPTALYGYIMGVFLGGRTTMVQVPGHDGGRGPCLCGITICSGIPHDSMEESGAQLHWSPTDPVLSPSATIPSLSEHCLHFWSSKTNLGTSPSHRYPKWAQSESFVSIDSTLHGDILRMLRDAIDRTVKGEKSARNREWIYEGLNRDTGGQCLSYKGAIYLLLNWRWVLTRSLFDLMKPLVSLYEKNYQKSTDLASQKRMFDEFSKVCTQPSLKPAVGMNL